VVCHKLHVVLKGNHCFSLDISLLAVGINLHQSKEVSSMTDSSIEYIVELFIKTVTILQGGPKKPDHFSTLNRVIDQLPKRLMMVIGVKGAYVKFRLD